MRNRFTVQFPRHQSEKLISVIPRPFPLPGNIQHSRFLHNCTPSPLFYFLLSSWPSLLTVSVILLPRWAVCRLSPRIFQPTHPLFLYHPLGHYLHSFFHLVDERTFSFSTLNRFTDKNRCLKEKEYRVLFIGGWEGGLNRKTIVCHCFFHWFHS